MYKCPGECRYGAHQPDNADDVYVRFLGYGGAEHVWIRSVCSGVVIERSKALEIVIYAESLAP